MARIAPSGNAPPVVSTFAELPEDEKAILSAKRSPELPAGARSLPTPGSRVRAGSAGPDRELSRGGDVTIGSTWGGPTGSPEFQRHQVVRRGPKSLGGTVEGEYTRNPASENRFLWPSEVNDFWRRAMPRNFANSTRNQIGSLCPHVVLIRAPRGPKPESLGFHSCMRVAFMPSTRLASQRIHGAGVTKRDACVMWGVMQKAEAGVAQHFGRRVHGVLPPRVVASGSRFPVGVVESGRGTGVRRRCVAAADSQRAVPGFSQSLQKPTTSC
jgi:hypothetical protein